MTQPLNCGAIFNRNTNIAEDLIEFKEDPSIASQKLNDDQAVVAFAEGILASQVELDANGLRKLIELDKRVAKASPETAQKLYKLVIAKLCPNKESLSALEEIAVKQDVLSSWPRFESALYKLNQLVRFFLGESKKPTLDRHSARQLVCLQYFELFVDLDNKADNAQLIQAMNLALRLASVPIEHEKIINKLQQPSFKDKNELRNAMGKLCNVKDATANPMHNTNALQIIELLDAAEISLKNIKEIENFLKGLDPELARECINTFREFPASLGGGKSMQFRTVDLLKSIKNSYQKTNDTKLRQDIAQGFELLPEKFRSAENFTFLVDGFLVLNDVQRQEVLTNNIPKITNDYPQEAVTAMLKNLSKEKTPTTPPISKQSQPVPVSSHIIASNVNQYLATIPEPFKKDVQEALTCYPANEQTEDLVIKLAFLFARVSLAELKETGEFSFSRNGLDDKLQYIDKGFLQMSWGVRGALLDVLKDYVGEKADERSYVLKQYNDLLSKVDNSKDQIAIINILKKTTAMQLHSFIGALRAVHPEHILPILKIIDLIPQNEVFKKDGLFTIFSLFGARSKDELIAIEEKIKTFKDRTLTNLRNNFQPKQ